jgi:hypothetical protein
MTPTTQFFNDNWHATSSNKQQWTTVDTDNQRSPTNLHTTSASNTTVMNDWQRRSTVNIHTYILEPTTTNRQFNHSFNFSGRKRELDNDKPTTSNQSTSTDNDERQIPCRIRRIGAESAQLC